VGFGFGSVWFVFSFLLGWGEDWGQGVFEN
jgi:hypothetical protein